MKPNRIEIELVPRPLWGKNLHNKPEWDSIRKWSYNRARHKCSICNSEKLSVHAHEKWEYDDVRHVQSLVDIECLCELCHLVKHIGYASETGRYDEALTHLTNLNDISINEAEYYIFECYQTWRKRSTHEDWKQNLYFLERIKDEIQHYNHGTEGS